MPSLNWIGKEEIINHHKEISFRLLKPIKNLSISENSENLIIEGDNLEALKAIMPYYYKTIKCIYIDPPYNTGNEKWIYNDNVNSPKIRKWLKKEVGYDDLCKHDKWLCMMYPRLNLLKDLLTDDGVMFISIDDNEVDNLIHILKYDIFRERNVDIMIWRKSGDGRYGKMKHTTTFRKDHEYIIVVFKDLQFLNKIRELPNFQNIYGNPDKDPRGSYKAGSISRRDDASDPNSLNYYTVKSPSGKKFTRQFEIPKEEFERLDNDILKNDDGKNVSRIYWGKNDDAVPSIKIYVNEVREVTPYSILLNKGTTYDGKIELRKIFNLTKEEEELFPNPKPSSLIKTLIQLATDKEDIILDSFAGSGTTGQAVLDLNDEDKGNRKFILIEMIEDISKKITKERVKRVIKGINGIGPFKGDFQYCKLDKSLFDKNGQIDEECTFQQLARYIYFTETQSNLDVKKIKGNFLDEYNKKEFYLIFIKKGKNVLNSKFLKELNGNNNQKIVYADKCLIDDEILEKNNIIFKQIPYEVKVY